MPTLSPSLLLPASPTPTLHLQKPSIIVISPNQECNKTLKTSSPNPNSLPNNNPNLVFNLESDKFSPTTLPNTLTNTKKLKYLLDLKRFEEAKDLCLELRRSGAQLGIIVQTMLIDALMKSGRVLDAFEVFDEMPDRNVVTWTLMVSGCIRNGLPGAGFSLFIEMLKSDVIPNDFSLNAALHACTELHDLWLGEQVHSMVIKFGVEDDCRMANCLMDVYLRSGLIDKAQLIFDKMPERDLVSFTTLISGLRRSNLFELAVGVFDQMVGEGFEPNEHTVSSVLTACGPLLGAQIHGYMVKTMLDQSVHSASSLIEFYSKNCKIQQANLVFENLEVKNVVTWSSMISCFCQHKQAEDALRLFPQMVSAGIAPNEYTFATALGACGLSSELIKVGRQLHSSIIKLSLLSDHRVHNALLTMYSRSGDIQDLEKVFQRMENRDVVSWCATVSGYFQNGFEERSIELLAQMHGEGYLPNEYGLSSTLSSCANLALLDQGKQFHCLALKLGCDADACVGNALINMYAKCGSINDARLAFDVIPNHDVMSWNSLIHGYASHGHGEKAMNVFHEMEANHIMPDHSTFVGILIGCSHVGCVEQAFRYFDIMSARYGIQPSASHYACLIDTMGRVGRLHEALEIINQMPSGPDVLIWKTLLGSCKLHKNLELGKLAAEKVIELSPKDSASYVLLSNMHATRGEWEESERMRTMMEEKRVKKDAGWSWIEIRNEVNAFVAGDQSHARAHSIYFILDHLLNEMREERYAVEMNFTSNDLGHLSEGLASGLA